MGKGVKNGGKVYSSIYRVYIIEIYKGKQRCGKKVAGKVRCGKSVPLLYIDIVYNSIIEIRKEKGRDKGMFIIYRYIEHYIL